MGSCYVIAVLFVTVIHTSFVGAVPVATPSPCSPNQVNVQQTFNLTKFSDKIWYTRRYNKLMPDVENKTLSDMQFKVTKAGSKYEIRNSFNNHIKSVPHCVNNVKGDVIIPNDATKAKLQLKYVNVPPVDYWILHINTDYTFAVAYSCLGFSVSSKDKCTPEKVYLYGISTYTTKLENGDAEKIVEYSKSICMTNTDMHDMLHDASNKCTVKSSR